jgi:hypothetical protein
MLLMAAATSEHESACGPVKWYTCVRGDQVLRERLHDFEHKGGGKKKK